MRLHSSAYFTGASISISRTASKKVNGYFGWNFSTKKKSDECHAFLNVHIFDYPERNSSGQVKITTKTSANQNWKCCWNRGKDSSTNIRISQKYSNLSLSYFGSFFERVDERKRTTVENRIDLRYRLPRPHCEGGGKETRDIQFCVKKQANSRVSL